MKSRTVLNAEAVPTTATSAAAATRTTRRRRPPAWASEPRRLRRWAPAVCAPAIAPASRAEARPLASPLGGATPRRKSRKRSSSFIQLGSWSRERENVRFCGEDALCSPARPVKPRAHRPDGHIKGKRDPVVAEVAERVEQQCIALSRAHRRQSRGQSSAKGRPVGSRFRLVLVDDPPIDSATRVGPQLTALGAEAATQQVRRDPVEPREGASVCAATRSPLEGGGERLRSEFIGEVPSNASMEVLVDSVEVPLEDQREHLRLAQGACEAVRVRQKRLHHPNCARRPTIGFTSQPESRAELRASSPSPHSEPTSATLAPRVSATVGHPDILESVRRRLDTRRGVRIPRDRRWFETLRRTARDLRQPSGLTGNVRRVPGPRSPGASVPARPCQG